MTTKQGIGLGLLCGIAVGVAGCVAMLIWTGERSKAAQADAYQQGRAAGFTQARGEGQAISLMLNEGLMQSNEDMSAQIDEALKLLKPLSERDDLPEGAKEAISSALETLNR
jgi:flagellar biosynthesis/type III secretory pathway protein FliH